jgi:glutaredoxin 3
MAKTIIYSTESCPWCHVAKDFLKDNNIEFEAKDVANDDAARAELVEKTGQLGVPVLDIDGTIIVGFDKAAISKALKIQG